MNRSQDSSRRRSKQKDYDYFLKTVIIGRSGVGKSSLMIRYCDNKFNDYHVNTIGVDFRFKTIALGNKRVKLQIWDTAGQEKFRSISSTYYRGADAIFLVYDLTNPDSFQEIKEFWIKEVEKYGLEVPTLLLVGNKTDLEGQRAIEPFEDNKYSFQIGHTKKEARVVEVSAKEDRGVEELFQSVAQEYVERKERKRAGRSALMASRAVPLGEIKELDEDDSGSKGSSSVGKENQMAARIQRESLKLNRNAPGVTKDSNKESSCEC